MSHFGCFEELSQIVSNLPVFRAFPGVFRAFSGRFPGVFRAFPGVFRAFSGRLRAFPGVFPGVFQACRLGGFLLVFLRTGKFLSKEVTKCPQNVNVTEPENKLTRSDYGSGFGPLKSACVGA